MALGPYQSYGTTELHLSGIFIRSMKKGEKKKKEKELNKHYRGILGEKRELREEHHVADIFQF